MRDATTEPAPVIQPFPSELLIWLSPSFPIGSFAFSQGLETAVDNGWIGNQEALQDWLTAIVRHGALGNDLVLISLIMRADTQSTIDELLDLSAALQPSAERAQESLDQGRNFVAAYRAGWAKMAPSVDVFTGTSNVTFSAALALAARAHGLDLAATLEAYAIAFCNNLLSAAIRLSVIGQFDGQRLLANLLPIIRNSTHNATLATLDELGSATYGADLASMLHETQTTRLFRS